MGVLPADAEPHRVTPLVPLDHLPAPPPGDDFDSLPVDVPYLLSEIVVAVVAIIGNAATLYVFMTDRKLRKQTNYYIASLALADLLVGVVGVPFAILTSLGIPRALWACLLMLSVLVVLCTISIFCLVAVSVDRYWAILYPMAYSRIMSGRLAKGIIYVCWILGTIIGFLPVFGWHSNNGGMCIFTQIMPYNFLVFLYFFTIVSPGIIMAYFYSHIYSVVVKQAGLSVKSEHGTLRYIAIQEQTPTPEIEERRLFQPGSGMQMESDQQPNRFLRNRFCCRGKRATGFLKSLGCFSCHDQRRRRSFEAAGSELDHNSSLPTTLTTKPDHQKKTTKTDHHNNSSSSSSNLKLSTSFGKLANLSIKSESFANSINSLISRPSSKEIKAAKNLGIIVVFFFCCWFPLYTINCVQAFCDECTIPYSLLSFTIILSHANSAINPILYAYHMKDFRQAFKTHFFQRLSLSREHSTSHCAHNSSMLQIKITPAELSYRNPNLRLTQSFYPSPWTPSPPVETAPPRGTLEDIRQESKVLAEEYKRPFNSTFSWPASIMSKHQGSNQSLLQEEQHPLPNDFRRTRSMEPLVYNSNPTDGDRRAIRKDSSQAFAPESLLDSRKNSTQQLPIVRKCGVPFHTGQDQEFNRLSTASLPLNPSQISLSMPISLSHISKLLLPKYTHRKFSCDAQYYEKLKDIRPPSQSPSLSSEPKRKQLSKVLHRSRSCEHLLSSMDHEPLLLSPSSDDESNTHLQVKCSHDLISLKSI